MRTWINLVEEFMAEVGFFFGDGFDIDIKHRILSNLLPNPEDHCAGESIKWYRHLKDDLGVSSDDLDFCEGSYTIDIKTNFGIGHYWLQVKGVIFDPTSFQFKKYGVKDIEKKNFHLWKIHENF